MVDVQKVSGICFWTLELLQIAPNVYIYMHIQKQLSKTTSVPYGWLGTYVNILITNQFFKKNDKLLFVLVSTHSHIYTCFQILDLLLRSLIYSPSEYYLSGSIYFLWTELSNKSRINEVKLLSYFNKEKSVLKQLPCRKLFISESYWACTLAIINNILPFLVTKHRNIIITEHKT